MSKVYILGKDNIPRHIAPKEGDREEIVLISLPGTSLDQALEMELDAAGASLNLYGLYLCPGQEKLNFNVTVRHNCGGCTSRQTFKGIVGGRARCLFNGLIYVAKDAQQTKAYQENHNLLLSDKATVETRPQLEIYADDVECSHGATVGKLDEQAQFYMRSRGIPEAEAKILQMISFISGIVGKIDDENLRQQIYDSLSEC